MLVLVSRGGAFKSNLTNADVWDGTTTTDWTGSGTEADPYLISKCSQLASLKNSNSNGKYFKLTTDLDLNSRSWSSLWFSGNLDGDSHTIGGIVIGGVYNYMGFFYNITGNISNLNLVYAETSNTYEVADDMGGSATIGGLANECSGSISNVNVYYESELNFGTGFTTAIGGLVGGLLSGATATNCGVYNFRPIISNIVYTGEDTINVGGIVGSGNGTIVDCYSSSAVISFSGFDSVTVGGIIGMSSGTVEGCWFDGQISSYIYNYCGGIVGSGSPAIRYSLFSGSISVSSSTSRYCGGILGNGSPTVFNGNISNGTFTSSTNYKDSIGKGSTTDGANCFYGRTEAMKLASTYSSWADFSNYYAIVPTMNDGYPILKHFMPMVPVTGFDGSGTETAPYLIKTYQDLLGMSSYYNDNSLIETDVYWKLATHIDVSKDANNALIHFIPICYDKEFDGYFDGNNYTISGLLIDNQYKYTGLFGTIGANRWVKNLTVKGDIYWDEAYAVGGVAGRVMAGGYLQNCNFEGNIIGVLNTKTSTECSGVVGKYEINGAIDCTATYTELKYAKIGGTSSSPTYTYYLYDWARITTKLYNKAV